MMENYPFSSRKLMTLKKKLSHLIETELQLLIIWQTGKQSQSYIQSKKMNMENLTVARAKDSADFGFLMTGSKNVFANGGR